MIPSKRIGEILIEENLITPEQLQIALKDQTEKGGTIGRNLILNGVITRLQLFEALSRRWGVPFVNLITDPPSKELLDKVDPIAMLEGEWVPYRFDGKTLTVASAREPNLTLEEEVRKQWKGKYAINHVITTDWDVNQRVMKECRESLSFTAAEELATTNPNASAKTGIVPWQRFLLIGIALGIVAGLFASLPATLVAMGIAANLFFTLAVGFKLVAAGTTVLQRSERKAAREELQRAFATVGGIPDSQLPTYTVLVPVFKEANIIHLIIEHLSQMDWPKAKLQILILMEEIDTDTIQAFKDAHPPEFISLLVVPDGTPRTKPRACNFGLLFTQGDYLVIYDAEDLPNPGQLRAAYMEFLLQDALDSKTPTVCLQAALNYFNWDQNLLTRMFTLEYSSWFDGMLPGMDFMRLPIPLGGTSNHFRTDLLRKLGGWDPYNVTEDADLGMRASSAGYKVGTVESTTWEEACSKTPAWIRQRTRWIKGYMVTALVDLRHPIQFTKRAGIRSLATLLGLVVGTPLMFLSYPLVWGMTIATYIGFPMTNFIMPDWMSVFVVWNAIVGNLSMIIIAGIAGSRRHGWRLGFYSLLNPIYWFLHAWAAWRALFQLVLSPHVWEKTPHGLSHGRTEVQAVR